MVVAAGPRGQAMFRGLSARGPPCLSAAGQRATSAGRGAQHDTSPMACPHNLYFLWVRPRGQEVCPGFWEALRQAGEVERAASPRPEEPAAPEGAQRADYTTARAGSSAPRCLGFPEPRGGPRIPTRGLARRKTWLGHWGSPADWGPSRPPSEMRLLPSCSTMAWCTPGKPASHM